MSTNTANLHVGAPQRVSSSAATGRLRAYFAAEPRRALQTALGLVWLLDGGLQLQSFMYSHGFIALLRSMTVGQPGWLGDSIGWAAHTAEHHLAIYNTIFALAQCLIGLGLLWRRSVKPALAISFAWTLIVWWFGEAFGMMFMSMASPLTGAPGAVLLYARIGLIVWPGDRPGGLVGVRGARTFWAALWVVMAWIWLQAPSSSPGAVANSIIAAPSGMSWLSTVQEWAAKAAQGNGLPIAIVLCLASAAIGIAVAANWHPRPFLAAAILLNLAYWVLGQGLGGLFEGRATDPNAGPLFVMLAVAMWALIPYGQNGWSEIAQAGGAREPTLTNA